MSSPKVSFVIPSYNSAAWLAHSVESAQKQTYANTEIIEVDDGSTDSTPKLMVFLCGKDARIKYIRNLERKGRSEARNIGNDAASGDYILVLDADDLAYEHRAKLTVSKLVKCDFVYGSADSIDAVGSLLGTYRADVWNRDKAVKDGFNSIVHSTCGYQKKVAHAIKYRGGEISDLGVDDWAFQLEAAARFKFDFIENVVGAYRELSSGISKTRDQAKVISVKEAFLKELDKVPA